MNKSTISILAAACSLISAQAGEAPSLGKAPAKGPVPQINVPAVCDCFNAGSSSVSVYASGLLPDSGAGELDDAFGGGLAYDYFFTPNVGVMVDATWSGTDSVTHLFTGSLEHWHYDTWKWNHADPFLEAGYITFAFDADHNVTGFKIDLHSPDFHFYKLQQFRIIHHIHFVHEYY
jgi:hypothetical protein